MTAEEWRRFRCRYVCGRCGVDLYLEIVTTGDAHAADEIGRRCAILGHGWEPDPYATVGLFAALLCGKCALRVIPTLAGRTP